MTFRAHESFPGAAMRRLERLAQLVAESPHNLVSARARSELATRHVPECVEFSRIVPEHGRLLDIGSGGGFPGLVIAVVRPNLEVHLLEATAKKAAFLREAATAIGAEVVVHQDRAEDAATAGLRGTFDIVTARAVAPLGRLAGWAAPFLTDDGCLLAIKGERWPDEIREAASALAASGLRVTGTPADDPRLGPQADHPQRPRVVMLARST